MKQTYTTTSPPGLLITELYKNSWQYKLISDEPLTEDRAMEIQASVCYRPPAGYQFWDYTSVVCYPGIFLSVWYSWDNCE